MTSILTIVAQIPVLMASVKMVSTSMTASVTKVIGEPTVRRRSSTNKVRGS